MHAHTRTPSRDGLLKFQSSQDNIRYNLFSCSHTDHYSVASLKGRIRFQISNMHCRGILSSLKERQKESRLAHGAVSPRDDSLETIARVWKSPREEFRSKRLHHRWFQRATASTSGFQNCMSLILPLFLNTSFIAFNNESSMPVAVLELRNV